MNTTVLVFLLLFAFTASFGQSEKPMSKFDAWVGHWVGEGKYQRGPGAAQVSKVDERVEQKLDGTILCVEGVGRTIENGSEKIVHHAYGVLSFDQDAQSYKFKSWLSDGKSADAWFEVVGTDHYQWGFEIPNGQIRYSILLDPIKKTWKETGEFSNDGKTWYPFFEMNLVKKG